MSPRAIAPNYPTHLPRLQQEAARAPSAMAPNGTGCSSTRPAAVGGRFAGQARSARGCSPSRSLASGSRPCRRCARANPCATASAAFLARGARSRRRWHGSADSDNPGRLPVTGSSRRLPATPCGQRSRNATNEYRAGLRSRIRSAAKNTTKSPGCNAFRTSCRQTPHVRTPPRSRAPALAANGHSVKAALR